MVSGTTFIAQLPDRFVDVVLGPSGAVERPRRLGAPPVPRLLVEFLQQPEQLAALRVRHPTHDRHDFFDGWHVGPPLRTRVTPS
jgi:hypothetical protein